MSETTTPSLVEPPPFVQEGKFTDEAAWKKWCDNDVAVIAYHLGWSGGGYGYDTEAEVLEAWSGCPGDNWTEAEHCDDARRILRDEGKEVYGGLSYRSVLTDSLVVRPDRTLDGWTRVGSCSAGATCEVQVDDEGTMRTTDIFGSVSVYECPQEFECRVLQCLPDYLPRGADANAGEFLLLTRVHNESTLEDVLDGLTDNMSQDCWEDIPAGSEQPAGDAVREAVARYGLFVVGENGIDPDDLAKVWYASLENGPDDDEGPYVYVFVKPV